MAAISSPDALKNWANSTLKEIETARDDFRVTHKDALEMAAADRDEVESLMGRSLNDDEEKQFSLGAAVKAILDEFDVIISKLRDLSLSKAFSSFAGQTQAFADVASSLKSAVERAEKIQASGGSSILESGLGKLKNAASLFDIDTSSITTGLGSLLGGSDGGDAPTGDTSGSGAGGKEIGTGSHDAATGGTQGSGAQGGGGDVGATKHDAPKGDDAATDGKPGSGAQGGGGDVGATKHDAPKGDDATTGGTQDTGSQGGGDHADTGSGQKPGWLNPGATATGGAWPPLGLTLEELNAPLLPVARNRQSFGSRIVSVFSKPPVAGTRTDMPSIGDAMSTPRAMTPTGIAAAAPTGAHRAQLIGAALTEKAVENACKELNCSVAELWTVIRVETRGYGYNDADYSCRLPCILYERHYFSSRTENRYDRDPLYSAISNKQWGGHGLTSKQYDKIALAAGLSFDAALESASWGLGQVMGSNWRDLGYRSVRQFVGRMCRSEDDQLEAMVRFITNKDIDKHLRSHNWASFAYRYNGSGYKSHKPPYDERLSSAHSYLVAKKSRIPNWLLRECQVYLSYLGRIDASKSDGVWGAQTRTALADYFSSDRDSIEALPTASAPSDAMLGTWVERLRHVVAQLPPPSWPLPEPKSA